MDFYNKKCSYCKEKFKDSPDIVVCPKCGNPYHRSCFEELGHCDHIKNKNDDRNNENEAEENLKVCDECGHKNSKSAVFCEKCGEEFFKFNSNPFFNETQNPNKKDTYFYPPFISGFFNGINQNCIVGDVKTEDICDYVQSNIPYYLYVFNGLDKQKLNKFNFSAFLFTGGWLLYRKNYVLGSIITFIIALSSMLSTYISYFYYNDILKEILSINGIDSTLTNNRISPNEFYSALIQLEPLKIFLFLLPYLLIIINCLIKFILGFNANKMYFKSVITNIKKIKETSNSTQEYKDKLRAKGGVNIPLGICLIVCYFMINFLPEILMT